MGVEKKKAAIFTQIAIKPLFMLVKQIILLGKNVLKNTSSI